MILVVATRNPGKLAELRALLAAPGLELRSADAFPDIPDVVEDGATFRENAAKKARAFARGTGHWALADDSGLEVDALGGAPGVWSARYAGEPSDPAANNRKLLAALAGRTDRAARFRCVIALADPGGGVRTVEGCCEGRIAEAPAGRGGFGYDPLFIPAGHARTFAQMPPEQKHAISHRGRALVAARQAWASLLAR